MINFLTNIFKLKLSDVNSTMCDEFCYYDNTQEIVIPPNSLVLNIDIEYEKQEFFHFYNKKMYFPYFGFNWNAFRDCVTDGSWIVEKNIVIIHSVIPLFDSEELYYYIYTLLEAVLSSDKIRAYHVYFPLSLKKEIEPIIWKINNS